MAAEPDDIRVSLNNASKEKLIDYIVKQRDTITTLKTEAEDHSREKGSIADAFLTAQQAATSIRAQAEADAKAILEEATAEVKKEVSRLETQREELSGDVERLRRYATDIYVDISKVVSQYGTMLEKDREDLRLSLDSKQEQYLRGGYAPATPLLPVVAEAPAAPAVTAPVAVLPSEPGTLDLGGFLAGLEEPVAEEPVAEEPAEEPAVAEEAPQELDLAALMLPEPVVEEPAAIEEPVAEEAADEPVAEEVADEPETLDLEMLLADAPIVAEPTAEVPAVEALDEISDLLSAPALAADDEPVDLTALLKDTPVADDEAVAVADLSDLLPPATEPADSDEIADISDLLGTPEA